MTGAASTLFLPTTPPSTLDRTGIVLSVPLAPPVASRLEYRLEGSAVAAEKDVRKKVSSGGLADLVELAAEDEAAEFAENGEKTVPSTLFAFSREASFLNSIRIREGRFGSGGDGVGSKSRGI